MKLKLMTFNIQHGRNHNLAGDVIDLPLMAKTVAARSADIVGFNEIRCGTDPNHSSGYSNQPQYFANALNGCCYFGKAINIKPDCGYGNAIFSKHPFVSCETVMIPDAERLVAGRYETRCVIKSEYLINGKPLTVLNTHFGLEPSEAENAFKTVASLAEKAKGAVAVMGDLNLEPSSPIIQKMSEMFVDAHSSVRNVNSTFPSNDPRMRIDYIFIRGAKIVSAETVKTVASDHYPITAEIEI